MTTTAIDIPLYGAAFLDEETLAIVGGGGLGNHGLGNKLIAINMKDNGRREYDFPKGSDCPMSVATRAGQIVVGANSGLDDNKHLRLFNSDLEIGLQHSLFGPQFYQRSSAIGFEKLAILGQSDTESRVYVLNSPDLSLLWEISTTEDVRDISFSESTRLLAVVLPSKVDFYDASTGKLAHTIAAAGTKFSRGKFTSDTKFVVVGTGAKTELLAYKIEEKPMLVAKSRIPLKSVTSLAVAGSLLALGSASGDVVVATDKLSLLSTFKAAHRLPVSGIAISSSGVVASVSVAGTLHIIRPPFSTRAWSGALTTIGWVALALSVLALLVAIILSRLDFEALWGNNQGLASRDSSSLSGGLTTATPTAAHEETVYETVWETPVETVYVDEEPVEEREVEQTPEAEAAPEAAPAAVPEAVPEVEEEAVPSQLAEEGMETVYETVYADPTTVYETVDPTTVTETINEEPHTVYETIAPTTIYELAPEHEEVREDSHEDSHEESHEESHSHEHAVEYKDGEIVHEHHIEKHNDEEPSVSVYDK